MSEKPEQYAVERQFNDEWQVERRFAKHSDASDYIKAECAKQFTDQPPGTSAASFAYRLREDDHIWSKVQCSVAEYRREQEEIMELTPLEALMDEATENKLRACARELLASAPGKDQRERMFHAIAAIAWESGDEDKPGFDASPMFQAFSDAMSALVRPSGVKQVDVSVVNIDRSMMLYTPNAKQPTVHNLGGDDPAGQPPYDA